MKSMTPHLDFQLLLEIAAAHVRRRCSLAQGGKHALHFDGPDD